MSESASELYHLLINSMSGPISVVAMIAGTAPPPTQCVTSITPPRSETQ